MSRRRHCLFSALAVGLLAAAVVTGCATQADPAARLAADQAEIRERVAAIREAILAKSAEGIVRDSTPEYQFTGPDGVAFDRAGFVARTRALMTRIVAIESLETHVDRVAVDGDAAALEITQTMVRTESPAGGGEAVRLWLRYRENHTWVRTPEGWRVRSVEFLGTPERRILRPDEPAR